MPYAVLLLLLVGVSVPASAAPIVIFNTGTGAEGSVDSNYSLISSANNAACSAATPCAAFITVADGFPIPPWLANSATSKWIQPDSAGSNDHLAGNYTYRTTFDLTGLDPLTASLSGQWAVDNFGLAILLNNVATGNTNGSGFTSWTPFTINSGFLPGVNTLDFLVQNAQHQPLNPSGLRVEVTGNALQLTQVPEPGTMTLLATGLAWAAARRRKRQGKS